MVRLYSYVAIPPPSPVIVVITQLAFVCTSGRGFSAQCNLLLVYVGSLVVPNSGSLLQWAVVQLRYLKCSKVVDYKVLWKLYVATKSLVQN